MATVKELANEYGVASRTVKRWVAKETGQEPTISEEISKDIIKTFPAKGESPGESIIEEKQIQPKPEILPPADPKPEEKQSTKAEKKSKGIISIVSGIILIATDAISASWIAWNAYENYPAAIIFGLAGFAMGYAAIKNALTFNQNNMNADTWLGIFALIQTMLHLSALQVLGTESFMIGKITIAIGIPLATIGLALGMRKDNIKL